MASPQPSVEYSEDFESKSPDGKSLSRKFEGDFEPFESDANSMLLFGDAIDLTNTSVDEIPGTSPLPGEAIMDKYGDGFDPTTDDLDASAEYEKILKENPEEVVNTLQALEEESNGDVDNNDGGGDSDGDGDGDEDNDGDGDDAGLSMSMDSSLSMGAIGGRELDEELLSDEENSIEHLIAELNESSSTGRQGGDSRENREMQRQLSIKKLLELQEREEQKALAEAERKRHRKAKKGILKQGVGGSGVAGTAGSKVSSKGSGSKVASNNGSIGIAASGPASAMVSAGNSVISEDSSVSTINTLPGLRAGQVQSQGQPSLSADLRPTTTKSGGNSRATTQTGARPPGSRGIGSRGIGSRGPGSRGIGSRGIGSRGVAGSLLFEGGSSDLAPNPINNAGVVTSHIGQDVKHDKAILERELDNAYKRIALYASENEKLRARLDHSALQQEFDTMKDILEEQDVKIEKLTGDKKGLEQINRAQGKTLLAMQYKQTAASMVTGPGAMRIPIHKPAPYNNHYPPRNAAILGGSESSESTAHPEPILDPKDIQIRILIQRVRRNQVDIKDLRSKVKTTTRSLNKSEKLNATLKLKVESLTNSLNELAMHYNNNITMVQQLHGDSGVSRCLGGDGESTIDPYSIHMGKVGHVGGGGVNGGSVMNENSSVFAGGGSSIIAGGGSSVIDGSSVLGQTLSNVQENMSTAHTVHALQHDIRKLQSIVDRQRTAHMKQVSGLRNALLHSQETKVKMQEEFMVQERTIKAQIAVVKQLRDTCEELADANQRLLLASDFYTQTNRPQQQPSSPQQPKPPSQPLAMTNKRPVPKPASVGNLHMSRPKGGQMMTSDFVVQGIESPTAKGPAGGGPFSPHPESFFLTSSTSC